MKYQRLFSNMTGQKETLVDLVDVLLASCDETDFVEFQQKFRDFRDFPLGIFSGFIGIISSFQNPDPEPRDFGIFSFFFGIFKSRSWSPGFRDFPLEIFSVFFAIFKSRSRSLGFQDFRDFTLEIFSGFFELSKSRSRSLGFRPDPWDFWIFGILHTGFFWAFEIPIPTPGVSGFSGLFDLAQNWKSRSRIIPSRSQLFRILFFFKNLQFSQPQIQVFQIVCQTCHPRQSGKIIQEKPTREMRRLKMTQSLVLGNGSGQKILTLLTVCLMKGAEK